MLIFIPESDDGSSMHLLRAESPGPQVGKLVSKMKVTARILYLIYLGMTVLEVIITLYFFIFLAALLLLAFDAVNGRVVTIVSDAGTYKVEHGFFSNFSAALTCISNVGPAFEAVGPYSSFAGYSDFSMIVLTLTMLLGRLEILPVLILFNRRTWKKI